MRTLSCVASLVVCVSLSQYALANGLVFQLPEDGRWAEFQMKTAKEIDGEEQWTDSGAIRVASVGQLNERGEKCRWIEVLCTSDDRTLLAKVLVPEKHIGQGQDPLAHVVRGWIKMGNREPEKLTSPKDQLQSILPVVLAPPLSDPKPLPEKVIQTKVGKLRCKGIAGHIPYQVASGPFRSDKMTFETHLHPKVPFGVVSSRSMFTLKQEGHPARTFATLFLLQTVGRGAESELAELR